MRTLAIVPTHDAPERPFNPDFFEQALVSLEHQTRKPDEVFITGNIGHGFISDGFVTDRLNDALEKVQCDAFFVLCDDDMLAPKFIEKTASVMEETGVDIVYTDCKIIGRRNCDGFALGEWTQANIDRNTVPLVTSLCSKSAWERAGKYQAVPFFDWDFWWRCFYTGATAYWLHEHLFIYRDHDGQNSNAEDLNDSRGTILRRHDELRAQYARAV